MKQIPSAILVTILLAIVIAFIAVPTFYFFNSAIQGSDKETIRTLVGGFVGAFFAFLFVRLSSFLTRIYEERERNYKTLKWLQTYLNDCFNVTSKNMFVAQDYLKIFNDESLQKNEVNIFSNRFLDYEIDNQCINNLSNLDLANELYSFNTQLKMLNNSMESVDRANKEIVEAFIKKGAIDQHNYLHNVRMARKKYAEVDGFLNETLKDTVRVLSHVRVLLASPSLARMIFKITSSRYSANFEKASGEERIKLVKEIEETINKSKSKFGKVLSSLRN